jgi:hypothetical protein
VFSHYAKANAPDASAMLPTLRLGDKSLPVPADHLKPTKGEDPSVFVLRSFFSHVFYVT